MTLFLSPPGPSRAPQLLLPLAPIFSSWTAGGSPTRARQPDMEEVDVGSVWAQLLRMLGRGRTNLQEAIRGWCGWPTASSSSAENRARRRRIPGGTASAGTSAAACRWRRLTWRLQTRNGVVEVVQCISSSRSELLVEGQAVPHQSPPPSQERKVNSCFLDLVPESLLL